MKTIEDTLDTLENLKMFLDDSTDIPKEYAGMICDFILSVSSAQYYIKTLSKNEVQSEILFAHTC